MFKKTILAVGLAMCALGAQAVDYYLVVPGTKAGPAVPPLAVTLNSYALPSGMVSVPYAGFDLNSLLAVTGDASYTGTGATWRVASGAIPAGLSLSASGQLSGTPTAAGPGSFTLEATYKTKTGTQGYQIVVANLSVSLAGATLPVGTAGQVYASYDLKPLLSSSAPNFNANATGWSLAGGTLPAGIQLNPSTGILSGTPTQAGNHSFTVRATYQGAAGEQSYDLSVNLVVALQAASLPLASVGTAYSYDFKPLLQVTGDASIDSSQLSFSVETGSTLPAGLSLSTAGVLSGQPSASGTSSFVVKATYKGKSGTRSFSILAEVAMADATWLPTSLGGSVSGSVAYSNSNHTVSLPKGLNGIAATTPLPTTGKWYWESVRDSGSYGISGMSVRPITSYSGNQLSSCGLYMYMTSPELVAASNASKSSSASIPFHTTIGHAYDASTRTLTFYLGNKLFGSCTVPGTATLYPTAANGSSAYGGSTFTLRTLPSQMSYAPPAGYTAGLPQ